MDKNVKTILPFLLCLAILFLTPTTGESATKVEKLKKEADTETLINAPFGLQWGDTQQKIKRILGESSNVTHKKEYIARSFKKFIMGKAFGGFVKIDKDTGLFTVVLSKKVKSQKYCTTTFNELAVRLYRKYKGAGTLEVESNQLEERGVEFCKAAMIGKGVKLKKWVDYKGNSIELMLGQGRTILSYVKAGHSKFGESRRHKSKNSSDL